MALISDSIRQELVQLYSEPDRFYHGLSHVEALLALLERHRAEFADPEAVEAAIWFHDCIYDTRAKDSEHRSAELAVARLRPACHSAADHDRLDRIRDMIEATATHTLPPFADQAALADASMFLDMDLSILGAEEANFVAYEAAVRKEYGWVSEEAWRKGRAEVLAKFAARPRIFYSDLFRDEYEAKARSNIANSLKKLGLDL